jgi:hypothetical protein
LVVFDYGIHHTPKPTIQLFSFSVSVSLTVTDSFRRSSCFGTYYHRRRFPFFVFSFSFFFSAAAWALSSFIFSEAGSRHVLA